MSTKDILEVFFRQTMLKEAHASVSLDEETQIAKPKKRARKAEAKRRTHEVRRDEAVSRDDVCGPALDAIRELHPGIDI